MTTVLAIGRWMPILLGHKRFLVDLAKNCDRLVIGIGSCNDQKHMAFDALARLGIPCDNGEMLQAYDENGVAEDYGITRADDILQSIHASSSEICIDPQEVREVISRLLRKYEQ